MIGLWLAQLSLGAECHALSSASGLPGLPTGPVSAALLDGGLGSARRACPRTELAIAPRALLLVDTPNFYGHIVAGLQLDGALALDADTELFGRLELVRYDSVISAVTSSALTPGHTTLGATRVLHDEGLALAWTSKLVLPTALGLYRGAWPIGLDTGLAGQWASGPWGVHGQLTVLGSAALSRGPALPRAGLAPVLGGAVRPTPGVEVVLDVQSMFLYTAPIDVVALAPAVRLGLGDAWGAALGGTVPLAGRERALTAVDLRVTWRRQGADP